MKFQQILNESYLNESYAIYHIKYSGSRKDYKIHDKNPLIIILDAKYNPDGNGLSILGINLNYYSGNKKKLIKDINKFDNQHGFKHFELKLKLSKKLKQKEIDKRIERYQLLKRFLLTNYPEAMNYIRRYKVSAIDKKRKVLWVKK